MTSGAQAASAMAADEVDRAFQLFSSYDRIIIAVSGGADSTALLHLTADWCQRHAGFAEKICVATIDHGLRAGSDDEARRVGDIARARGLSHIIKTYDGPPPAGPFSQEWARELRYGLLTSLAGSLAAPGQRVAIVAAHHRDDQAETILMRLARGSGVEGLGAIRPVVRLRRLDMPRTGAAQIDLLRPLLGFSKAQLQADLIARGARWIEDPSNANPRFERVRLRERAAARVALGLDDDKLALSARRAQRASAGLNEILRREMDVAAAEGRMVLHELGYATLERSWLEALVPELRLRLLMRLLHVIGGQSRPISLGALEAQSGRILGDEIGREGFSLHGALIDLSGGPVVVTREPLDARMPRTDLAGDLAALRLTPGLATVWDNRFILELQTDGPTEVRVGPLCQDGVATLEGQGWQRPAGVPARVLWTLPAVWHQQAVLWAPVAQIGAPGRTWDRINWRYNWARVLDRPTRLG